MSKHLIRLIEFFNKHSLYYVLLLAFVFILIFFGLSNLRLDRSIYGIFPKSQEYEFFNDVLKDNALYKKIVFSLETKDLDESEILTQLDSASNHIALKTDGYLIQIETNKEGKDELFLNHLYTNLPAFLSEEDYIFIDSKLQKDSVNRSLIGVADQLTSLNSLFMNRVLGKDPLGILWGKMEDIKLLSDSLDFQMENGLIYLDNGKRVLFTAQILHDLNEEERNLELEEILNDCIKEIEKSGIMVDYFAPFLISNANARQVKKDTYSTLIITISLILLLLFLYYRSILIPFFFIIPIVFSGFLGLGLMGYIQPDISAISIAISAVLLGIVLDYSFHFMTHYTHSGNVLDTIKEISSPMIFGSFTTIAAFSALMFTDSIVLQNFGLLALLTLSSAVLVTLFFLPIFIGWIPFTIKKRENIKQWSLPSWVVRIALFSTVFLSCYFFIDPPSIYFDSDLNNLSFHPEVLKQKEEIYTGLDPEKEKKILLFVHGDSFQEASDNNFRLYTQLRSWQKEVSITQIISVAPYALPQSLVDSSHSRWRSFWHEKKDTLRRLFEIQSNELGFAESAFNPFFHWIEDSIVYDENSYVLLAKELGMSNLISKSDKGVKLITSITVDKDDLENLKLEIKKLPFVFVFDTAEIAGMLIKSVQADFNYLLIFSSLLVFLSFLVVYGRIELAIFSFFPLAVCWVWILYLASWLDIQFNFVNIMIATIIFGLGDDFSIFVTHGLIQKYKERSKILRTFKSSIILSALTTIMGTGVLIFAKHPAINSIALLSVTGIASILLVTVVVQPAIFDLFITKRIKKKHSPLTLLGVVYTSFLYIYFATGSILLNFLLIFFVIIPAKSTHKRQFTNYLISKFSASTLFLGFHIRKKIRNREKLNFDKPAIIICNHISFLDILLTLKLNPKVIIVVKEWVYNSPFFGLLVRYSGYIYIRYGVESNLDKIKERIEEGYSIVIFPEGTRSPDGKIKRFHKGAFYAAQQLNIDIQPLLITGTEHVNPTGDFIIKSGTLTVHVLDRISSSGKLYKKRFGLMTKEINSLMRSSLITCRQKEYNATLLGKRVLYNYLYKGPVLEWYVRIKWMLEKHNFELYDQLIGERKILYDLGCGYGYLSYFLHYRDSSREIHGIDYDKEKIKVAQNGFDKSANLKFFHEDLKSSNFRTCDAVILNDVLHYLKRAEREQLLESVVSQLNPEGLLIIREGITDYQNKHRKTIWTETISTQLLKFNKTGNTLEFISKRDIQKFAEKNDLSFEMMDQSKTTSNVVFVLRKS